MIPNFDVLGSLVRSLHDSFVHLFYLMLPLTILLSVIMGYFKSGDPDFPDILKRAFVASLLLVSFPEVSNLILDVCDGIALKIDNMSGLETVIRMAQEKSQTYSMAKNVLLLKFDDIFIAILSFASFMLLSFARYITVALYYFFWVLLSALSPLMILAYVFPSTAGITRNLYRGLIEVACWKILWAVLSAMLTSLSFGNIYQTEGSYITLTIMNFAIAVALLFTPLLMRALIGDGVQATAQNLGTTAFLAATSVPSRFNKVRDFSREILNSKTNPTNNPKPRR